MIASIQFGILRLKKNDSAIFQDFHVRQQCKPMHNLVIQPKKQHFQGMGKNKNMGDCSIFVHVHFKFKDERDFQVYIMDLDFSYASNNLVPKITNV